MGKYFKSLLIALIILIIILIIVGLFLPTEYSVSRSTIIDASPEEIHDYVGDLKKWNAWEPWREEDPSIVITCGEKTSGVGASQPWTGKDGDGSLIFTSSSPINGVEYDLFFDQGKYECKSAMLYYPVNEGKTKVTWSMKGDMNTPIVRGYLAP